MAATVVSSAVEVPDRGLIRRALLAIGLFCLVMTGIHAGADRADDTLFEIVSALDELIDGLLASAIPAVLGVFGVSPETGESWAFRALEAIDLDAKLGIARVLALFLEALVGLALALPLVDPRAPRASRVALARAIRSLVLDPTLLLWAAPIAVGAASLAGTLVVIAEMETLARATVAPLELGPTAEALGARAVALAIGLVVITVLGVRGTGRALVRAEALSTADHMALRSRVRRRLRGLFTALIAVPLALFGAIAAVPAIGTLLLPWVGR